MANTVRYPIGFKLNVVITAVLLFSLGLVIFLVALFVRAGVEETAVRNNNGINRMAARVVAVDLSTIRADTLIFLRHEDKEEAAAFFFSQRDSIAAIVIPAQNQDETAAFYNRAFMDENEISSGMADAFLEANPVAISRARVGEAVLLNAAPFFDGAPLLALILPAQGSDRLFTPVAVFFSSQELTDSFGTGANSSFLTNDSGDAIIHSDQELIKKGGSLFTEPFVRDSWNSGLQATRGRFKSAAGYDFFGDFERVENFDTIGVFTSIQSSVVFEGINAATRRNITLSVMIAFLSILFIWFFSKSFSGALVELREAVEQIDGGNYHITLKNKKNDETGVLGASIVSMSYAISNFERFVNRMIVRLSREGKLLAEGTDKTATLFFSDIRAFTAISEKIEAQEIVAFLNDYMERMVRCVNATGGVIDKFIGDAVMAHWGLVESAGSKKEDALAGARAALMMRACLMNFNARRRGDTKEPKIKIGCGLNTGPVVAGQIGSYERIVYTAIGESVSFADRVETFNKPFGTEILMSEHTWNYVHDEFVTEEMPSVKEAGKTVRIFALINIKNEDEGGRLLAALDDMPGNDPAVNRRCLGADGPKTLKDLRALLDIEEPDLSALNMDEEERKYAVAPPGAPAPNTANTARQA